MNGKQAKALLIEDDPLYAQAIRGLFMAKGVSFELEWASSLQAGVARLSETASENSSTPKIDIVLLDLALPDSDGLETFTRIHRLAPDLPIIVLTATNDDEIAIQAMQAGAQDYLVKGDINRHLLQRAMRYAIERQRNEMALRETQRLIHEIADIAPEFVTIYDLGAKQSIYINRQLANLLGIDTGKLTQLTPKDWIEREDYAQLEIIFEQMRLAADNEVVTFEYRARHSNGEWRWLHSELTPFNRNAEGEVRQILITSHDVTERRQAELALRQSEERYRDLVENGGLYVVTHDTQGRILSANQTVLHFLGFTGEKDLQTYRLSDFLLPAQPDDFTNYLDDILKAKRVQSSAKFQAPGGKQIVLEFDNTLRVNGTQAVIRCIARDVTDRVRATEAVRTTEDRYHDIVENSGLLIGTHDVEGRFVAVNRATWEFFGCANAAELEGRLISDILTPEASSKFKDYLTAVTTAKHASGTMRVKTAQGEERLLAYDNSLRQDAADVPQVIRFIAHDITDRRQSEVQLRAGEERFRLIAENSTDLIGQYSQTGEVLYASPALTRLLGYAPADRIGHSVYELFHPDDVEEVRRAHRSLLENGGAQSLAFRYRHQAGNYVWCESNAQLLKREDGQPDELLVITRDISERKRADEALRESEERYRDLFENANDVVFTCDLQGRLSSFNKAGELLTGYTRDEVLHKGALEKYQPDFTKIVQQLLESKLEGKSKTQYELTVETRDEKKLVLEVSTRLIYKLGQPVGVQAIARDVTERKRVEEERNRLHKQLEAEQQLFQAVLKQMPAGVMIADATSEKILLANEQAARLLRVPMTELVGELRFEAYELNGKRIRTAEMPLMRAMRNGETVTNAEVIVRRNDGSMFTARVEAAAILRHGRTVAGVIAFNDISEQKHSDERIREQAALLNCATDAIIAQDLEGSATFWNHSAAELYGWTEGDTLYQNVDELIFPETARRYPEEIRRRLLEKNEWHGELRQRTKDGREITVESRYALVRDDAGQPKSILVINTDITQRKQLEAQLLRMQRTESIGSLASGIAHDLNNALAPILMALHTLQQKFTDPNSQHWLQLIRKSAERSRDLVDQVLTFARGATGARLPLELDDIIGETVKMLRDTLPKNIALDVRVADDLWPLNGDKTQINQVLMNLCINARDAMPQGGKLKLTAENITLNEDQIWSHESIKPGPFLCVKITDSGAGISTEVINRIFDPFFTTKEQGKGTGLGLSTSLGIVKGHGGFIEVDSQLGHGAEFRVHLPADEEVVAELGAQPSKKVSKKERDVVLAVDDEPTLLEVTRITLETAGYRVIAVGNGAEALSYYRQHFRDITLVLTDLAMPGLDGLAASIAMRNINPEVKIIATSGLKSQSNVEDAQRVGLQAVLWKPFSAEDLLSKVDEVIYPNGHATA